ncbi:hypothetical protein UlMin_019508 [Ulmus minor]
MYWRLRLGLQNLLSWPSKACGCPLLPLKSHARGPAPVLDQEAITFFRANVFLMNFDIKSCRTLAEETKAIITLGLVDVPVPGETGFPFPGFSPILNLRKK